MKTYIKPLRCKYILSGIFENYFNNISLRRKILISYIVVTMITIFAVGYFTIEGTVNTVLNENRQINEISFLQLRDNLSRELNGFIKLSDTLSTETLLLDYLEKEYPADTSDITKIDDYRKIDQSYTNKFFMTKSGAVNIYLYTSNQSIIKDNVLIRQITDETENLPWYREIVGAKGASVVGRPYLDQKKEWIIPIRKQLIRDKTLGYTNISVVEFPESLLYSLIQQEMANKRIYLLSSDGIVITSSEKPVIGTKYNIEISDAPKYKYQLTDGNLLIDYNRNMLFQGWINNRGPLENWSMISYVPSTELINKINTTVKESLLVCLLSFAISVFFIYTFSGMITTRLQKLLKNMGRIGEGNFTVTVSYKEKDEIGELSRSFKQMVDRINTLISDSFLAQMHIQALEIEKSQAEIHALQSQINPHFLFNTMESIRMNLLHSDPATSEVVHRFTRLLRTSIDWSSDKNTIGEEIDLIETYLKIQTYRFVDKFEYSISCDKELLNYIIPKFTLQPLVENAIYHGLEMKEGKGLLEVTVKSGDENILISVKDNGVGIPAEKLALINESIDSGGNAPGKMSIGLRNVNARIKLYYGKEYGISINSRKFSGTEVLVNIPKKHTGGQHV